MCVCVCVCVCVRVCVCVCVHVCVCVRVWCVDGSMDQTYTSPQYRHMYLITKYGNVGWQTENVLGTGQV